MARGHEVTVFHRGTTEPAELPPVEHVHGDRDGGLGVLGGRTWDVALDTCAYVPRQVREVVQTLADAVEHYGFVSTLSVYPDEMPAGGTERSAVHPAPYPDTEEVDDQTYGPLKVACELEALGGFAGRCLIVRPGYIVGPHDPTDRFTYWVLRASEDGEMLAPAPAEEALQVVDVRDLAAFTLDHLEARTDDVFGVVGPEGSLTWGAFLRGAAEVAGSNPDLTWVDGGSCTSVWATTSTGCFPCGTWSFPACIASTRPRPRRRVCATARSPPPSPTRSRGNRAGIAAPR